MGTSRVAMDNVKHMEAIRYTGGRMIRDFTQMKVYYITESTKTCTSTSIDPLDAAFQCLPATASLNTSSTFGYGPGSMDVQIWDIARGGAGGVSQKIALQGP